MCLVFETLGKSLYDFIKDNGYKGMYSLMKDPKHLYLRFLTATHPINRYSIP
jgi:hypothetical protein